MALRDITIGRYIAGNSPVHRLDPRTKLAGLAVLTTALFAVDGLPNLAVAAAVSLAIGAFTRLGTGTLFRGVLPFRWLILAAVLLNLLFTGGRILVEAPLPYGGITLEGLTAGVLSGGRLAVLVYLAAILTLTTEPVVLVDGIEKLLRPLRRLGLHPQEAALAMVITIRFIPILIDEATDIRKSLAARGFGPDRPFREMIAVAPYLFTPLLEGGIRRAEHLAVAMECRLYRYGAVRTRYREVRFGTLDVAGAFTIGVTAAGILLA